MTFLVQVKNDRAVHDALPSLRTEEGDRIGENEVEKARRRIRAGAFFVTYRNAQILRALWRRFFHRGGRTSPFVNDMQWKEGRIPWRPFVAAAKGAGSTSEEDRDDGAHRWVQAELYDLGEHLGETVQAEFTIARGRIDVLWVNSGIAWEVDLSPQPFSAQLERREARQGAGFRMISVIDSATVKESVLSVETVVIRDLKRTSRLRDRAGYTVSELFIENMMELASGPPFGWRRRMSYRVAEFCAALIAAPNRGDPGRSADGVSYLESSSVPSVLRWSPTFSHAWFRRSDVRATTRHLAAIAAAEQRQQRERIEKRLSDLARQAEVLQREVQQCAEEAERLRALDLFTSKRRRQCLTATWPIVMGDWEAKRAFERLAAGCTCLEGFWSRCLCILGLGGGRLRAVGVAKAEVLEALEDVAKRAQVRQRKTQEEVTGAQAELAAVVVTTP